MQINLTEVLSYEGMRKEISTDSYIKHVQFGEYCYDILDGVHTNVILLNIGSKEINISGDIEAILKIPCSRCMEDIEYKIKTDFSKDVKFDDNDSDEVIEYINGYNLDLEKLVLNELIINLPMKVLCSDTCKGICNQCGVNLNKDSCNCDKSDIDPRLAVFKDLFNEF